MAHGRGRRRSAEGVLETPGSALRRWPADGGEVDPARPGSGEVANGSASGIRMREKPVPNFIFFLLWRSVGESASA